MHGKWAIASSEPLLQVIVFCHAKKGFLAAFEARTKCFRKMKFSIRKDWIRVVGEAVDGLLCSIGRLDTENQALLPILCVYVC